MSQIHYRSGDASIVMDDTLQRMVESVLENVVPATTKALNEHVGGLYEEARADWPIKSGYSRDSLEKGLIVERDRIVFFIRNDSGYARFIKARNLGGRRPWTKLVISPSRKRRSELGVIAGRELLAAHGGN